MKRLFVLFAVAAAMVFGSVVSAHAAATTQSYTFVLPRLQADLYSGEKSVASHKDFGVFHKYSGGYPVAFTVCNTAKSAIGPRVVVYPGGSGAELVDLWYNSGSSSKTVRVRLESAKVNVVTLLAQGTWRWNY